MANSPGPATGRLLASGIAALLIASCSPAPTTPDVSLTPSTTPTQAAVSTPSPSPTASAGPTFEPADLRIMTIGDSIAHGGVDCDGCTPFTALLEHGLEAADGIAVAATDASSDEDLTGRDWLRRFKSDPGLPGLVSLADVVVISIGKYDTPWNSDDDSCDDRSHAFIASNYTAACISAQVERHAQELDTILGDIEALRAGNATRVAVLTDYNDIIGLPEAPGGAADVSREILDAFATATCRVADAHGAACVDVYHAFNGPTGRTAAGSLLARDYFHPSASGHARIAELLLQLNLQPPAAAP